jgi:hypothetical protein
MIIDFPIKIFPFKFLNNIKLNKLLIKYLKKNKCCNQYPKCFHPKEQSDSNVFNINNKTINELKINYYEAVKNIIKNFKIINTKAWVFYVCKNKKTPGVWHQQFNNNYKNYIQISGLCYLTDTNIGTEFKNELFNVEIKPKINHWYLWDSFLEHRPKEDISPKDRIVIATATILEIV